MPYKDPAKKKENDRLGYLRRKQDPKYVQRNKDRLKIWNEANKERKAKFSRERYLNYLDTTMFRWEDVEGFDGWTVNKSVHHRLEMFGFTAEDLKAKGWYYNCTPDELLCLPQGEHLALHKYLTRISY